MQIREKEIYSKIITNKDTTLSPLALKLAPSRTRPTFSRSFIIIKLIILIAHIIVIVCY